MAATISLALAENALYGLPTMRGHSPRADLRAKMKHIDPSQLAILVTQVFGSSSLAEDFNGVDVSVDELDDKNEFIRVLVRLKNLDKLSEEEADSITAVIEKTISEHDDRFPSIRFADP